MYNKKLTTLYWFKLRETRGLNDMDLYKLYQDPEVIENLDELINREENIMRELEARSENQNNENRIFPNVNPLNQSLPSNGPSNYDELDSDIDKSSYSYENKHEKAQSIIADLRKPRRKMSRRKKSLVRKKTSEREKSSERKKPRKKPEKRRLPISRKRSMSEKSVQVDFYNDPPNI